VFACSCDRMSGSRESSRCEETAVVAASNCTLPGRAHSQSRLMPSSQLTSLEICAGAGGQALGLELAGFTHAAAVEIDGAACETLRTNRPSWAVIESDVRELSPRDYRGIDLLSGGVPCPPFSVAGKQLGADDDRDLFPAALRLIQEIRPSAVMLENVPGLATSRFSAYRRRLAERLVRQGYEVEWQVLNACNYLVPQLRQRFILVALRRRWAASFDWPQPVGTPPTVGETLRDLMGSNGWRGASRWADRAKGIAPTLVGGSKKHGGPDLGPTRARLAWRDLGVEARSLAETPPDASFPAEGLPRLTVRMTARIQGFPDSWTFVGKKTAAYRQVGNAFPPPVAFVVASAIRSALEGSARTDIQRQPLLALYG
jgi:DNA (cytosine-5)-methyltransferase 1